MGLQSFILDLVNIWGVEPQQISNRKYTNCRNKSLLPKRLSFRRWFETDDWTECIKDTQLQRIGYGVRPAGSWCCNRNLDLPLQTSYLEISTVSIPIESRLFQRLSTVRLSPTAESWGWTWGCKGKPYASTRGLKGKGKQGWQLWGGPRPPDNRVVW